MPDRVRKCVDPAEDLRHDGPCRRLSDDDMQRGTARLWKEPQGRWAIQIEIDGAFYTERDYEDAARAAHAIAQILRQHADRGADLDEDDCEECGQPLDLLTCSQCGADGFALTCEHGGPHPIRMLGAAIYCRTCRP